MTSAARGGGSPQARPSSSSSASLPPPSRRGSRGGGIGPAALRRLLTGRALLVGSMAAYWLAGAALFARLERPPEERALGEALEARRRLLVAVSYPALPDLYRPNWTALVDTMLGRYESALASGVRRGVSPGQEAPRWDVWSSLVYAASVYTTIGYGNMTPLTDAGRLATIVYAIFGIPLCMMLLNNLANTIVTVGKTITSFLKQRKCYLTIRQVLGLSEYITDGGEALMELIVMLSMTVAYAFSGAMLYLLWERWTVFEAIYFVFISLTTVGFGDIVPQKPLHFVLSSAYVFVGLALTATCIGKLQKIIGNIADLITARIQRSLESRLYGNHHPSVPRYQQAKRLCASFYAPSEWRCTTNPADVLRPYKPPAWATHLRETPSHCLLLAQKPTPIQEWDVYGVPSGTKLCIKRDDLTGSTLTGNKVRKLEFLMADCLRKQCRHVITCGSIQSNHCRSVAVAGAQLGLRVHMFLRTDLKDPDDVGYEGNLLLDRLTNADVYLVPRKSPYKDSLLPRMLKLAVKLRQDYGESSYLIPVGGSDKMGIWGYIEGFREMLDQGIHENFDDVVVACGTGGTAAGLALGNYLSGSKLRCHAIAVCDDARYFHSHINEMLDEIGVLDIRSESLLNIVEGHKGKGYGLSTEDELAFVYEVARTTGIILDPTYTGKAAYGLWKEMQNPASPFKDRRVLFVHTGGLFGTFDMRIKTTLMSAKSCVRCGNSVKLWED